MRKCLCLAWAASMMLLGGCSEKHPADAGTDDGLPGEECPWGTFPCAGGCVDPDDHENCGACGHACSPVEVCDDGECLLECPAGKEECSLSCVDLQNDHEHCGGCGDACAASEVCSGGSCSTECAAGMTDCDGSCVDLHADDDNCGACRNACAPDEACVSGTCRGEECGDGTCDGAGGENPCTCRADCGACSGCCDGETCRSGSSDSACGTGGEACEACDDGEECSEGSCSCSGVSCEGDCCPASEPYCAYHESVGHAWCSGCNQDACAVYGAICCPGTSDCVSWETDERNCNGCAQACPAGEFCSYHSSVGHAWCSGCNPDNCAVYGVICCPGTNDCVDWTTDENNCGGCAVRCGAGQTCQAGTCGP
jgi:hypothetical protein